MEPCANLSHVCNVAFIQRQNGKTENRLYAQMCVKMYDVQNEGRMRLDSKTSVVACQFGICCKHYNASRVLTK